MCGITGFISRRRMTETAQTVVTRMSDQLRRRGPDSNGWWVSDHALSGALPEVQLAFGHRRLAIVDLSSEGHQPMHSASGRFVITFNGEIYNYRELRAALAALGHTFRGHSDTEVMLAAFEQWGMAAALKRMVGMFAFALWDQTERALFLARDRMGEKPLYYGWLGESFLFGSTLNALRAHPDWQGEINRGALALLMRHNYVPAPYSIFERVWKVPPATWLKLTATEIAQRQLPAPQEYWSARAVAETGTRAPLTASSAAALATEAVEQLDQLLRQAIAGQMIADVPLGAFLSGGIDSSTIVALMQAQSTQPVQTFTIGFDEPGYNEAEFAKAVAQHLGTRHTELYVKPEAALDIIPQLPEFYDEPFADSSQLPTLLVSQLARQSVTVSLSGDAGDELFCGYRRYLGAQRAWERLAWIPAGMRQLAAHGFAALGAAAGLAHNEQAAQVQFRAAEWAQNLATAQPELMYHRLASHWEEPAALVLQAREPLTPLTDARFYAELPSLIERMMYLDTVTYLPDDILVKVDRASMAYSLEARVPLLDHRLVEFAWRVPQGLKLKQVNGAPQTKWLLRQVLYRYVPPSLIERPKSGFAVPLDKWLRGPLRAWAEALLSEQRLREGGYLNAKIVRAKWQDHLNGRVIGWRKPAEQLWNVLMFQAWIAHGTGKLTATTSA